MTAPSERSTGYDVVGIGNALVDVLAHQDDGFLAAHGLGKGTMALVDAARAEALYGAMGAGVEASGGSAANTIAGIAGLGGRAAFIGRVSDDQLGQVFAHDLQATGVTFRAAPVASGPPTGRCLIVVTPDAERTMSTYLGSSELLGPDQIDAELIAAAQVTFLEGYLFDQTEAKEAYWKASRVAHEAGRQVALTLSDTFCVERHRSEWRDLVRDQVDVLFANEAEALALYEVGDVEAALAAARADVEVVAITRGSRGSIVARGGEVVEVQARPVEVVDTTGAGDLYAAGFLFGHTQGRSLGECGRLGSAAAAAVLGHTGARPTGSLAEQVAALGG